MTNLLHDIISNLGRLTEDEIITLNRAVCNEFKTIKARQARVAKATLAVGDTVEWSGRRGHMSGELIKINRKNAKVRVGLATWTVPMTMLKVVA
tara:strand:- start:66 stop:347 length:282 start_codon:yes stop_codon:yes gene_type:complete